MKAKTFYISNIVIGRTYSIPRFYLHSLTVYDIIQNIQTDCRYDDSSFYCVHIYYVSKERI